MNPKTQANRHSATRYALRIGGVPAIAALEALPASSDAALNLEMVLALLVLPKNAPGYDTAQITAKRLVADTYAMLRARQADKTRRNYDSLRRNRGR